MLGNEVWSVRSEIVLEVVRGIAEEEDVPDTALPVVIGEGEEVSNGVGSALTVTRLVEELVDGNGGDLETLTAPQVEKRFGGLEELSRPDGEVVGAVGREHPARGGCGAHVGAHHGCWVDDGVGASGLGVKAERVL